MDDFLDLIEDAALEHGVDNIAVLPPEIIIQHDIDPTSALSIFDRYHDEIDNIESLVVIGFTNIRTEKDNIDAVEVSTHIKALVKTLEDERKRVKEPYLKITRLLDGKVKELRDRLDDIKADVDDKIREYLMSRKQEQTTPNNGEVIPEISDIVRTNSGCTATLSLKKEWTITRIKDLPDECFTERADHIVKAIAPWINAQMKAGITDISGVQFTDTTILKTK